MVDREVSKNIYTQRRKTRKPLRAAPSVKEIKFLENSYVALQFSDFVQQNRRTSAATGRFPSALILNTPKNALAPALHAP